MDLINYRYKYKLVSHPFKLLLKILKDRYLIHNEFYRFIRGKKTGDLVPVLITCKSCNHKGIAELKNEMGKVKTYFDLVGNIGDTLFLIMGYPKSSNFIQDKWLKINYPRVIYSALLFYNLKRCFL
jgi:hypothetical protein